MEAQNRAFTPRQQEIIREAIRIIAADGIGDLTIKNLAGAVHVTEAALYRHFQNKQAILAAIIETFDMISRTPPHPDPHADALDRIEWFVQDRYIKFAADPDLAKIMLSESIFIHNNLMAEKKRRVMHGHKGEVVGWIEAGQRQGGIRPDIDAVALFRVIVGSMRLLVLQWCFNHHAFDLKKEGRRLWLDIRKMARPAQWR